MVWGEKVPITHFDPATALKQVRKINCFFSKEALHSGAIAVFRFSGDNG